MKKIIQFLEKPKVVIPTAFVIAIIVGLFLYGSIGKAPVITFSDKASTTPSSSESVNNSVDLAFPKAGRLLSVSVGVGSVVKKGDVLASLDAGDALGAVNQTKGALELAKAQYASLDIQYANTKKQQDVLVANAYRTLLSSNLVAVAQNIRTQVTTPVDTNQAPKITGSYTCDKEGSYYIEPYSSQEATGYSFNLKGLETGSGAVTYYTSQQLGSCGLFVEFPVGYYLDTVRWVIDIPNTKSANYVINKNAYDLAVANRDQVLKQLEANLGKNGSSDTNVAQAAINAAEGAYEVAQATYKNNLIVAPLNGIVTFVDSHLKDGQSVSANKTVMTITKQ